MVNALTEAPVVTSAASRRAGTVEGLRKDQREDDMRITEIFELGGFGRGDGDNYGHREHRNHG
ncbi:MAG: hypothetical protein ACRDS0_28395, partial [Pseudonocardiaceae bacterium]